VADTLDGLARLARREGRAAEASSFEARAAAIRRR